MKNGGLVFSLDNKRYDEQTILSSFDKVYTFKGRFVGKVQTTNYKKKGKIGSSPNHVYYQNWVAHKKGVMWNMNCAYLGKVFDNIVKIWVDVGKLKISSKLKKVVKFYKGYYKNKVTMMRIDEEKVRWSLEEAQILFHFDLSNSTFQEQVALICNTFQAYELRILKGQ